MKGPLQLYAFIWANVPFCWPSWLFAVPSRSIPKLTVVRDKISSCVHISKKHFLGTNRPQEVCQRHLSKTNSHLHQMQATKTISPQTGVKKFSSPKRTPTRHSAAKDFSVWRRACFIMAPKTGSRKLVEIWRPERDLNCTRNWNAQREKACVNTYAHASALQICLQNICGQQQNFPMAGPTFGSKSGPQNGAQAKTSKKEWKCDPILDRILGSIFGPKNVASYRRISLLSTNVLHFRPCFRGHNEAGFLAFKALRGSPRPARDQASDAKRNGTRTKRGSRGLESIWYTSRLNDLKPKKWLQPPLQAL